MAIAFDDSTDGGLAFANTLTFSHTTSGSDRYLTVSVFSGIATDPFDVTGVTYNSASMVEIDREANTSDRWVSLWGLIAPASGANNVVATVTGGVVAGMASSYTGVDQTSPVDSFNSGTIDFSIDKQQNTIVVATGCWLVGAFKNSIGSAFATVGTLRETNSDGLSVLDSNGIVSTGSRILTAEGTTSPANWGAIVASLAPSISGGTTFPGYTAPFGWS